MSDYYYKVPPGSDAGMRIYEYDPVLVDYHYRLEWDLTKERPYAALHQVRIFDQGGDEGRRNFERYLGDMRAAEQEGIVTNITVSHRRVIVAPEWTEGEPMSTFSTGSEAAK